MNWFSRIFEAFLQVFGRWVLSGLHFGDHWLMNVFLLNLLCVPIHAATGWRYWAFAPLLFIPAVPMALHTMNRTGGVSRRTLHERHALDTMIDDTLEAKK
jgi:hypothetical protein